MVRNDIGETIAGLLLCYISKGHISKSYVSKG